MLKSMTGYGQAILEKEGFQVKVLIKTLNSKTLDVSLSLPREIEERELEIRNFIGLHLERGKIDVRIHCTKAVAHTLEKTSLHTENLWKHYHKLHAFTKEKGLSTSEEALLQIVSRFPDVVVKTTHSSPNQDEVVWSCAMLALEKALKASNAFRVTEGKVLKKALQNYVKVINVEVKKIIGWLPKREIQLRAKLEEISKNNLYKQEAQSEEEKKERVEQEILFYLEKYSLEEERVRLLQHLKLFQETLAQESAGRKLLFIAQEINREVNTLGNKANHYEIQKIVVDIKCELNHIKEQLMNVL